VDPSEVLRRSTIRPLDVPACRCREMSSSPPPDTFLDVKITP
jgi:hypothetical protein